MPIYWTPLTDDRKDKLMTTNREPVNGHRHVEIRFNQFANQLEISFIELGNPFEEEHSHRLRDIVNPLEIDQFIFNGVVPIE